MLIKISNFIIILNLLITSIGLFGVFFNKKNFLLILISLEIIFLGLNLNFALLSIYLDDIIGHIFILFILVVIAAESVIALSLFTILYQFKKSIVFNNIKENFVSKI